MEKEYPWRVVYERAVLETDDTKLPRFIEDARIVMNVRLRGLGTGRSYEEAPTVISAALESLRVLESKRLGSNS